VKFCILKIGGLGDILMVIPGLRALRKSFPRAHITFIIGESNLHVLNNCPYVDEVLSIDDEKIFCGNLIDKIKESLRLATIINSLMVDRIFILQRDWRWNLLAKISGVPKRSGFARDLNGLFCTDPVSTTSREHEIIKYQKVFATQAGYTPDTEQMELFPDENDHEIIRSIFKDITGTVIAIAPGGASNIKEKRCISRWPLECYIELAHKILHNTRHKILLIGGPGDKKIAEKFGKDDSIINYCGSLTVSQSYLALKQCKLLITHDCGPMHIGAAAKIPVISLFGPTDPAEKKPITSNQSIAIWHGSHMNCAPCYQDGFFPNCQAITCMRSITVEEVFNAIKIITHQ